MMKWSELSEGKGKWRENSGCGLEHRTRIRMDRTSGLQTPEGRREVLLE